MKKISLILLLVIPLSACFAITPDQTIKIKNNTNQPIDLNLTIPKRTAAAITMTKLKSAHEMLHKAILDNSAEGIKDAVLAGADVNLLKDGKSPLLWAVLLKRSNAVRALLEYQASVNDYHLSYSLKLQDIKSAYLLGRQLDYGINKIYSSPWGFKTLFCCSLYTHDYETALMLARDGADTSCDDHMILYDLFSACENIQNNVTNQVNTDSLSLAERKKLFAVQQAQKTAALELFNLMVAKDPTELLKHPISYQKPDILKILIKKGVNLDYVFDQGGRSYTPLFMAMENSAKDSVTILLDSGANINKKANPHYSGDITPLQYAINYGGADMVEILLMRGASLS